MIQMFDEIVELAQYPSGETYPRWRFLPEDDDVVCHPRVRTWDDLMHIILLDEAAVRNDRFVKWFIPYFPFARDDRRRGRKGTNPLQKAIKLLEGMDVVIADPHSYGSMELPFVSQKTIVKALYDFTDVFTDDCIIVIPDKGATAKAMEWISEVPHYSVVQADKVRDPETGGLFDFHVPTTFTGNHPVVIFDDICDGGGTFLGLRDEMKANGAREFRLAVTHGLFTNGMSLLNFAFDQIVSVDKDLNWGTIWDYMEMDGGPN